MGKRESPHSIKRDRRCLSARSGHAPPRAEKRTPPRRRSACRERKGTAARKRPEETQARRD